ncbi:hypothetical protein F7C95_10425 [Opitutia bacterium ISCC 51]|nr:hypothetical protein F7C95_10425 [Opitutae bacterium ISCC 51]QXD26460.1 hypothetical protein GA003_10365 [Opitutae bacterium ISCC 52]
MNQDPFMFRPSQIVMVCENIATIMIITMKMTIASTILLGNIMSPVHTTLSRRIMSMRP